MRVRRYRAGGAQAPVVALVDGDSLGTVDGSSVARDLGVPLLAVMLPPRRDDCALRLRVFTMARELPLSLEAAWAARAALDGDVVVELGVTGTRVGVRDGLFVAEQIDQWDWDLAALVDLFVAVLEAIVARYEGEAAG